MASGGSDRRGNQGSGPPGNPNWGWKKRWMRGTSAFEGKTMPLPRPGDAPHRSCTDCWQGLVYELNDCFRCTIHDGQDLPGSAERKRRDEFRVLVESGQLPEDSCVRCWNGRRRNPGFQCPEHRVGEYVGPDTTPSVPEISEAVMNPKIVIPEKGVIDPYTGREMCQIEVDTMMAEPENAGKCFAEVIKERKVIKEWMDKTAVIQRVPKIKIEEEDIVLTLDFLGIWNLFTDVIQATGTEVSNELDRALGRALRGHLDYQIKKHHLTRVKKQKEGAIQIVPVPVPLEEADLIQWDDSPPIHGQGRIDREVVPMEPVPAWMIVPGRSELEIPRESDGEGGAEEEKCVGEKRCEIEGERDGAKRTGDVVTENETDDEKEEVVLSILGELFTQIGL